MSAGSKRTFSDLETCDNETYTDKLNKLHRFFHKFPETLDFYVDKLYSSEEDEDKITKEDYKNILEILNKDKNFRVLKNEKVIFIGKSLVPEGMVECGNCGLIWDGFAQCPCWQELNEGEFANIKIIRH